MQKLICEDTSRRLALWEDSFNMATPFMLRGLFPRSVDLDFDRLARERDWGDPLKRLFIDVCEAIFGSKELLGGRFAGKQNGKLSILVLDPLRSGWPRFQKVLEDVPWLE